MNVRTRIQSTKQKDSKWSIMNCMFTYKLEFDYKSKGFGAFEHGLGLLVISRCSYAASIVLQ